MANPIRLHEPNAKLFLYVEEVQRSHGSIFIATTPASTFGIVAFFTGIPASQVSQVSNKRDELEAQETERHAPNRGIMD